MARDDDRDKKTSDKRGAGEGKASAKVKDNGGSASSSSGSGSGSKASESKKRELGAEKAVADKPKEKGGDKPVKKAVKDAKVREADVPAKPVRAAVAEHAHAGLPHGHHAPNRKEYWKIFVVLFVLTVI